MLNVDEINRFHREGYLVFEGLIAAPDLARFVAAMDRLVEKGRQMDVPEPHFSLEFGADEKPVPGLLHKVQGVCEVAPELLELAGYAAILDRVEALLGRDIDVFGTKFFPKLPGGGTSTHWHQDNFYFGTNSEQILSCGVYLQDADKENGCLQVVPGSHVSGAIADHSRTPRMHGSWTEVDEEKAAMLPLVAGSVVLFSANLLHGTQDNQSQRSRYSTAWHYVPGALQLEQFPRGSYKDRHIVRGI
jgi:phytanoyl-CoA hydroxylase